MKEFEEFKGDDFEQLLRMHGFETAGGSIDRQSAADFLGVCKRTIGYMLSGRVSKQMYNMLALHTGHHQPGLVYKEVELGDLTDSEFEELMEASDADVIPNFDSNNPLHVHALQTINSLTEKDWS